MFEQTYRIETLDQYGHWDSDLGSGDNTFATEADANAMIEQLRTIDDDWANADYRVVANDR